MSITVNNSIATGTLYPTRKERPVDSRLSRKQRACIAASSALGVTGSLAILAKCAKGKNYSLNPKKILNTKIKDTYFYQKKFEEPEIVTMGAGSILGGLVGGVIVDERTQNTKAEFKSKVGEALIQFGNITVPILTVGQSARWGDKLEKHIEKNMSPNAGKIKRGFAKLPKLGLMAGGLAFGMYSGNVLANYLKRVLLDSPVERKMKPSDLFMHWDDFCLAASFYSEDAFVHGISRLIPFAMMVAGYQVGCKGLERSPRKTPPPPPMPHLNSHQEIK